MNGLNKILSEVFQISETAITDHLSIDDVDGWDSLTHMDLVASIEESFGFELTMDEILEMRSVKQIREVVSRRVN